MVEIWGTQNERRTWNQWDTCNARLNVFALKHTLAKQHLITPFVCYRNIILICLKYIKTQTTTTNVYPILHKRHSPPMIYIRYAMHYKSTTVIVTVIVTESVSMASDLLGSSWLPYHYADRLNID